MPTHIVKPAETAGYVSIVDAQTGAEELVFVGEDIASRLLAAASIQPIAEAPSQKWCSLRAA